VDLPADVIICRHVIEHISKPVELLTTIRLALARSPNARLFFETPNIDWILRRQVIWDVFYEHCSYFTPASLTTAFEVAGFHVDKVTSTFEGQYLWVAVSNRAPSSISKNPADTVKLAEQFAQAYRTRVEQWTTKIQSLITKHRVALWGAGAKGVTFANLIDPRQEYFAGVVDLNSSKQGGYLPGTGHPVLSPEQIRDYGIDCILVLNPNYFDEIQSLVTGNGLTLTVINMDVE
jgi:hypothetical protein